MKILPRLFLPVLVIVSTGALFSSVVYAQDPGSRRVGLGRPAFVTATPGVTRALRSCQAREEALKTRSARLVKFVNNMLSVFDNIATRVEKYYTNTVLPSGKSVSNYGALVADIQSKKVVVQTDLAKAQADLTSFSCSSVNPKAAMTLFRTDMQTVKKALKDFRTSIRNLIVAVHSVTGEGFRESTKSAERGGGR